MRLARFEADGEMYMGRLDGDVLRHVGGKKLPREFSLNEVRLLSPSIPSKVVAVGLNYRDHAEELNMPLPEEPLLFMKPSSSVIGPGQTILLPPQSQRIDFEAELAVVMGRTACNVKSRDAREYILGYTCLNDVTARDLQSKDGQWTRAKGFDTFCPLGPWVETEIDPSDLAIQLYLNGERKQNSRTSNLIFDPYRLVEFVSAVMTLFPGDVIATGTSSGIGPMKSGDIVEVRIEGIGSLENRVRSATE
jgi:2-keto-4-pentenoate hydratase/2-oxohepta-3-ene-1,7-dioic acid hydratase in catechol pathway